MSLNKRNRFLAFIRNPAWISLVWFGMTAGVSMLATPVRFTASTITRPVALDVGRVVFAALNKAELVALIILLIIIRTSHEARKLWMIAFGLALIVLTQGVWLIPELAARTDMIIAGSEPPSSMAHGIYSSLELIKLALLFYLGFRSIDLMRSDQSSAGSG